MSRHDADTLQRLRDRFSPIHGGASHVEMVYEHVVWATWAPESGGTRYDILVTFMPPKAFGRTSDTICLVAGTPGVQRVAFLAVHRSGTLAASYLEEHLNRGERGPFSTEDIYRLTEMVSAVLGRQPHLPDERFHLPKGDTPFKGAWDITEELRGR